METFSLAALPASVQARPDVSAPEAVPSKSSTSNRVRLAIVALVLAVLAGLSAWAWHWPSDVTLAVLPFDNLSGDPDEYLAVVSLRKIVALDRSTPRVHIVGRTSIMSYIRRSRQMT
jgi:TolB-like protein